MFSEFKQAVENISNSSDILEVMFLFYFDKKTFTWYKHLIDNRTSQKNQTQLGILYDMEQSFICSKSNGDLGCVTLPPPPALPGLSSSTQQRKLFSLSQGHSQG